MILIVILYMLTQLDYKIGALIGFFVGIFGMIVLANVGFKNMTVILALPWLTAIMFTIGVIIGGRLARRMPIFGQITKFAAVGFLNTAIDFGILNGLSLLTGIAHGLVLGGVNVPGFVVAMFNGYFWNKFWVFPNRNTGQGLFADFPKFLAVSIGGLLVNTIVVVAITGILGSLLGADEKLVLNAAKLCATLASMIWNFVGYKFIVFRKKDATPPMPQTPPVRAV